ncbi:hypothetical protein GUJ93_ZPchr0458g22825 [Zizania palustris]|uniref:Vacuolar ATPase assembly integral membrane protein VMA21 homolog n=1 Tax=Zizania palustris TaxID=103762 RepID=A0A8J5UUM6_ZIZPA|nr:hypothetical protein GUJ93_ZPchr0458g22825 [Zizania palustris]
MGLPRRAVAAQCNGSHKQLQPSNSSCLFPSPTRSAATPPTHTSDASTDDYPLGAFGLCRSTAPPPDPLSAVQHRRTGPPLFHPVLRHSAAPFRRPSSAPRLRATPQAILPVNYSGVCSSYSLFICAICVPIKRSNVRSDHKVRCYIYGDVDGASCHRVWVYYQIFPGVSQWSSSTQTLASGFLAVISVNLVIGFYICMAMKETPHHEPQPDPTFLANAKASINQPTSSQVNDDSQGKGKGKVE